MQEWRRTMDGDREMENRFHFQWLTGWSIMIGFCDWSPRHYSYSV
jgi:hypothetical protein